MSIALLAGCASGVHDDGPGGTEGPTLAANGNKWCAEVSGAFGFDDPDHKEIKFGTPAAPPVDCRCLAPDLHTHLENLIASDPGTWDLDTDNDDDIDVTVVGPVTFIQLGDEVGPQVSADLLTARNNIIDVARDACEDMRDNDLGYDDTQSPAMFPGCANVADKTDEPDVRDPGPDVLAIFLHDDPECVLTEELEIDTGGYDGTYTLSNVIVYNSGEDVYEIDDEFFEDMFDNPDWWLGDTTRLIPAAGGGWELDAVSSSDIAYALGLREGDIFVSINSMPLDDMEDAADALYELRDQTEFTLVVERSGNDTTFEYEKI